MLLKTYNGLYSLLKIAHCSRLLDHMHGCTKAAINIAEGEFINDDLLVVAIFKYDLSGLKCCEMDFIKYYFIQMF